MKQRLPLLLLFLLLVSRSAFAQLTVVNPSDHITSMSLGFYVEKGLFKGWNTKGWFSIAPHDSITLLPEGIAGGAFYYHGQVAGCDQGYAGNYALFVHPKDVFSIAGAGSEVPVTLNEGVKKVGFVKVDLPAGQRRYRLRLPAVNCTQQGIRTGDWLVYLDRDKEEVTKPDQAAYVRRISYQQGTPTGIVRDYFWPSNQLQWDGKLLSERPATKHGTCITYDETGHKREEALYQNGRLSGTMKRWDASGQEIITAKKYRTVKVLEPQQGYLVSYYNPGNSRTVIPVQLPANTVSWYYEFTAFREQTQLQAARNQFKLVGELAQLVTQANPLALAVNALSTPPGGNICNVYLFQDTKQADLFQAKQAYSYLREGTRTSLTSAVVPMQGPAGQRLYLGLHNPDNLYGIHYALEVVAIVEEEVERTPSVRQTTATSKAAVKASK